MIHFDKSWYVGITQNVAERQIFVQEAWERCLDSKQGGKSRGENQMGCKKDKMT